MSSEGNHPMRAIREELKRLQAQLSLVERAAEAVFEQQEREIEALREVCRVQDREIGAQRALLTKAQPESNDAKLASAQALETAREQLRGLLASLDTPR